MYNEKRGLEKSIDRNIESLAVFHSLDQRILNDLAQSIMWVEVEKDRTLFRQGDAADAMYMVDEGMLHVYIDTGSVGEALVGRIGPGALVGEIAFLMGGKRNATVRAAERSRLARLGAEDVQAAIAKNPEAKRAILEIVRKRLRRTEWLKILPAYIGGIDETKYEFIESRFEWAHLDRGETLFSVGDAADGMYFLVRGLLHVISREDTGEERAIGAVFKGEIVGEMAILSGETRTATVRAVRDSDLVRLTRVGFEEINKAYPGVSLAILRILANRLKQHGRMPRRNGAVNIALVAAGPGVPLPEFSARLQRALRGTDKSVLVDSAGLAREFSANPDIAQVSVDDPLYLGLVTWLEELESHHDYVLYQADVGATPWTQCCLRQADRILIVGRSGDDPEPGAVERDWLVGNEGVIAASKMLVLIHPEEKTLPSGTMEWLSRRTLSGHLHLRGDREEGFSRLARIVNGRSVGLVLGGGGARGMAHLGVIRALEERGIPVDFVCGASIGSIIGGAYAMGMDWRSLLALFKDTFATRNPLNDYTIPVISLLRSRNLERTIRRVYGDARIEDLWLNFFCVSTNLGSCSLKVHTDGPLWLAARTSSSLPGIMVPLVHEGFVHVDGGVINNLPGDIMRKYAGCIITVDVDSREDMRPDFETFPSPWKLIWSKVLPWKKPIPSPTVSEIMMATIMAGNRKSAESVKRDADLNLEPPVNGTGILDFKAIEETAGAGYEYAKVMIDAIPETSILRRYLEARSTGADPA